MNGSMINRSVRNVNLGEFKDTGLPTIVAKMDLECPYDTQYILRMAIAVDNGPICVPNELEWIRPMLAAALDDQGRSGAFHPFIYVTVRHGLVVSQTDDEWHVDGFSTKVAHRPEHNYIWSNQDGTEYVPLTVEFPEDFDPRVHNVNHYLQRFVDDAKIRKCEDKVIVCMDPYILHRRPSTTTGTARTFVRISFVPIEINDVNNTANPLIDRHYTADGVAFRNQLLTY